MLTVIVTLRVAPGAHARLEADYQVWSKVVKRDEPGTLLYSLCRSRDESDVYYALEQYRDDAAMQLHVANWQARADAPDVLSEPPSIKIYDSVPEG